MKNGNQQAKDEFTTTIRTLEVQIDAVVGHAKDVTADVEQFSQMLDQDTRNFKSDSEEAKTKIIGDNGELKALQDQLDAIYKAMDRDRALIAEGESLIGAGTGSELIEAGRSGLLKEEGKKHDVEHKIAMERQELKALNAVKSHIDGLVESMVPVSSALTSLEGAWASLKSDFEDVATELKSLSSTSAAAFLGPLLEKAKKDWKVALDRVKQLQARTKQF